MEQSNNDVEHQVAQELRQIGIPPCPRILLRIHDETQKVDPDFNRLAAIIGDDVALAAGLIKVVNSPYFGFQKKVRSVNEAMLVIGLKTIIHAVATLQLQKAFAHLPRMERFWHSSAKTAHVASWLAKRLGDKALRPTDAYTYALFHDCGVPVLLSPFKNYMAVLQQANDDVEHVFTALEDQHFGVNHSIVGAQMAEDWLLPVNISMGIRHHHEGDWIQHSDAGALDGSAKLVAIAHLAEHCIYRHTGLSYSREWEKLGAACLAVLSVDEKMFDNLINESAFLMTQE